MFKTLGPLSAPVIAEIELIQNQTYIHFEKIGLSREHIRGSLCKFLPTASADAMDRLTKCDTGQLLRMTALAHLHFK